MNPGFACLRPLCHGISDFGSVQTDILSHEPEMVIHAHFTLSITVSKTDSKGVMFKSTVCDRCGSCDYAQDDTNGVQDDDSKPESCNFVQGDKQGVQDNN